MPKTPQRLVWIDDQRRSPPFGKPKRPMFLRVERVASLPITALDGGGKVLARFSSPEIAAHMLGLGDAGNPTLPQAVLDQLADLL